MPPGIGYPDESELTNRAIDDLLGDEAQKKRRDQMGGAPDGSVTPDLRTLPTIGPGDARIVDPGGPPSEGPRDLVSGSPLLPSPQPDLSRAPSGGPDVLTGARPGAQQPGEDLRAQVYDAFGSFGPSASAGKSAPDATLVTPLTPPTGALAPQPPSAAPTPPPSTTPPPPNVGQPASATRPASTGGDRAARPTGGASTPQEAYGNLSGRLDPNASQDEMEAAIEAEFGHLPGYGGAYKESVMLNGKWYDMVVGYGGPNASWGGLTPKGSSKKGGFLGLGEEGGGLPQIDDESRLDAILASIDAMAQGKNSPLVSRSIDQMLAPGTQQPQMVAPMMAQPQRRVPARRAPTTNAGAIDALLAGG